MGFNTTFNNISVRYSFTIYSKFLLSMIQKMTKIYMENLQTKKRIILQIVILDVYCPTILKPLLLIHVLTPISNVKVSRNLPKSEGFTSQFVLCRDFLSTISWVVTIYLKINSKYPNLSHGDINL
jgi:hypothetical protein